MLPARAGLLAEVFPVLRRVEAVASAPRPASDGDPQQLRRQLFTALRELLARVASKRALVVVIDDLQWADADSLALLEAIMRPPDAPAMLLVATARAGEDAPASRPTLLAAEAREVHLSRLPPDEARALAAELLSATAGDGTALAELRRRPSPRRRAAIRCSSTSWCATRWPARADAGRRCTSRMRCGIACAGSTPTRSACSSWSPSPAGPSCSRRRRARPTSTSPPSASTRRPARRQPGAHDGHAAGRLDRALSRSRARDDRVASHGGRGAARARAHRHRPRVDRARRSRGAGDALAGRRRERQGGGVRHAGGGARLQGAGLRSRGAALPADAGDAAARRRRRGRRCRCGSATRWRRRGAAPRRRAPICRRPSARRRPTRSSCAARRRAAVARRPRRRRPAGDDAGAGGGEAARARVAARGAHVAPVAARAAALRGAEVHAARRRPRWRRRCWRASTLLVGRRSGLGNVDTIRGADFATRHLLLALEAGEPSRVARAMAFEACLTAAMGADGVARANTLAAEAEKIADEVKDSHATGLAVAARAIALHMDGHWARLPALLRRGRAHLPRALHRRGVGAGDGEPPAQLQPGAPRRADRAVEERDAVPAGGGAARRSVRLDGAAHGRAQPHLAGDGPARRGAQRVRGGHPPLVAARLPPAARRLQLRHDADRSLRRRRRGGVRARRRACGRSWRSRSRCELDVARIISLDLRGRAAVAAAAAATAAARKDRSSPRRSGRSRALREGARRRGRGRAPRRCGRRWRTSRRRCRGGGAARRGGGRLRRARDAHARGGVRAAARRAPHRRGGRADREAARAWMQAQAVANPDSFMRVLAPGFNPSPSWESSRGRATPALSRR